MTPVRLAPKISKLVDADAVPDVVLNAAGVPLFEIRGTLTDRFCKIATWLSTFASTAISGLPSPSRSPIAKLCRVLVPAPTLNITGVANEGLPLDEVFCNKYSLSLLPATIMSGLPSPSISFIAMLLNATPVATVMVWAAANEIAPPGKVVLSNMPAVPTVLALPVVVTISRFPSPSKSLMAMFVIPVPTVKSASAANDRVPPDDELCNISTRSVLGLSPIISGIPSPSRSAAITRLLPVVRLKLLDGAKDIVPPLGVILRYTNAARDPVLYARTSGFPSPSKSAMAIVPLPGELLMVSATNEILPGVEVLWSTTMLPIVGAITTSGLPSPSRSPMAILLAKLVVPIEMVFRAAKDVPLMLLPEEMLSNTPSVLSVLSSTTISGLPSPSISAMATATGALPAANVCGAENVEVVMPPVPEKVITKGSLE